MARFNVLAFSALLLVGCASKSVFVEYQQPTDVLGDWYPIPTDAPNVVEVQKLTVPKLEPYIEVVSESDSVAKLVVTQLVDSLGNPSLKVNRQTGNAWELVDSALIGLDWRVNDRDRRNYKFELDQNTVKRSFLSRLLGNKDGVLNLVLIPQGNESLIVVEGDAEALPSVEVSTDILNALYEYLVSA